MREWFQALVKAVVAKNLPWVKKMAKLARRRRDIEKEEPRGPDR